MFPLGRLDGLQMSRVRLYAAVSADGVIADIDGATDWLAGRDPASYGVDEFYAAIGAVIIGRRTYDYQLAFGEWPYTGKRTFVVTSRPLNGAPAGTTAVRNGVAAALAAARTATADDIWIVGGAVVMRTALAQGAVDIIDLFSVPVLLGTGLPMIGALDAPISLTLNGLQTYQDGVVKLSYSPRRG